VEILNYPLILGMALTCYLLGSIPFGVLVTKLYGKNLIKLGSGSTGFTNVVRAVGLKPALWVLLFDFLKGWLSIFMVAQAFPKEDGIIIGLGVLSILGHTLSPFLKFKGGKGAATGIGILAYIDWRLCLGIALIVIIVVKISRTQSLGTLMGVTGVPVGLYFLNHSPPFILFSVGAVFYIYYTHRQNILRLLKGTENKIGKMKP